MEQSRLNFFCVRILAALIPCVGLAQQQPSSDGHCSDPSYTVTVDSPADGETFEINSGQTASGTGTKICDNDNRIDVSDSITWSADASGSGASSNDFTTDVGAKTLTALLADESDSITTYVVEKESITLKDTSTDAGTRETTSALVMVYSDSNRTADIEFAYTSGGSPGDGYPSWSDNGITANTGDLTGSFSAGVGEYDITITYANSATETVTVEVVDEEKAKITFDSSESLMQDILNKGNAVLANIYDGDSALSLSGEATVDFKLVDTYGDASSYGYYAAANGSISFSAGAASAKSPPIIVSGVSWRIEISTSGVTITATGSGIYDESASSPGSFDVSIAGNTTFAVGGSASVAIATLSVQGSVGIGASGGLNLDTSGEVTASGSIGVSNPTLTVTVNVNIGFAEWERDIGEWQAPLNASQDFGPTTVYNFQ